MKIVLREMKSRGLHCVGDCQARQEGDARERESVLVLPSYNKTAEIAKTPRDSEKHFIEMTKRSFEPSGESVVYQCYCLSLNKTRKTR